MGKMSVTPVDHKAPQLAAKNLADKGSVRDARDVVLRAKGPGIEDKRTLSEEAQAINNKAAKNPWYQKAWSKVKAKSRQIVDSAVDIGKTLVNDPKWSMQH
jgi:hypothetical protein